MSRRRDEPHDAGGPHQVLDDSSYFTLLIRHEFVAFAQMVIVILLGSSAPAALLWHVQAMAKVVQDIADGVRRRVIVTVPPRHLKSTVATVAQIAWRIGRDPHIKILLVSYSKELSKDLLGKVRAVMAHPWYRRAFPQVAETLRINRADLLQTAWGGKVTATSFAAGFTGMGADLIIVDDPLSAQAAFSESQRQRCNRTCDEGLRSRLDDPAHGAIAVVMQRFHEEDLVGHLQRQGDWHELRLPLVAEEAQEVPLGAGRVQHRTAGTSIDPVRMPVHIVEEINRTVGSVVYSAQYQQDPQPAEGALLRLGNMGTYTRALREYDELVIAVDTALETGVANDYTACVVLGRSGHRIHVLQVERARLPFIEQVYLVRELTRNYPAAHVLIEAANSGGALIQELRRNYALHVTAVSPRRSKEQRAVAVAPLLENGNVCFPQAAEWLGPFLREVRTFPHGANDDMVDAFVHGLGFLKRHIEREQQRPAMPPDTRPPVRARPRGDRRPAGAANRPMRVA
jgi:predicted phage terminase large subunit-like protein